MSEEEIKNVWQNYFAQAPLSLRKTEETGTAVTAFNTNIDAVLKMSGKKLSELIKKEKLSLTEIKDIKQTKLLKSQDVLKGVFKAFCGGIAEEWLSEEKTVYDWMKQNLGYDRLQMGGQGGSSADDR